jgi:uncharacterized protein DUF6644
MDAPGAAGRALLLLEDSPLAASVRGSAWLYPAIETMHIAGFTVLVGAAAMFDLRLLGLSQQIPVTDLARHLLRWSRCGATVAVPTGLLLFAAHATDVAANPVFRLKLVLIALAALNALLFHARTIKGVQAWDVRVPPPRRAQAAAVASLCLWAGVISCGRLIAYW